MWRFGVYVGILVKIKILGKYIGIMEKGSIGLYRDYRDYRVYIGVI